MYGTFSSDPFALSIQRIIQIFQASTERTAKRDDIPLPYQQDKGITMMKDAIHRVQRRMIHRVQSRTIRKKTHKRYHKKDT